MHFRNNTGVFFDAAGDRYFDSGTALRGTSAPFQIVPGEMRFALDFRFDTVRILHGGVLVQLNLD